MTPPPHPLCGHYEELRVGLRVTTCDGSSQLHLTRFPIWFPPFASMLTQFELQHLDYGLGAKVARRRGVRASIDSIVARLDPHVAKSFLRTYRYRIAATRCDAYPLALVSRFRDETGAVLWLPEIASPVMLA